MGGEILIMKWKKSLWGYAPQLVEEYIKSLNAEFEKQYEELNDELLRLEEESKDLRNRIKKLEDEIHPIKSIESEIGKRLLKAHLDASYEVYNTIRRYKFMQKEKVQAISDYKPKLDELEEDIKRIMDEIQAAVSG